MVHSNFRHTLLYLVKTELQQWRKLHGKSNKTIIILMLVDIVNTHTSELCPRACDPLRLRFGVYGGHRSGEIINQCLLDVWHQDTTIINGAIDEWRL